MVAPIAGGAIASSAIASRGRGRAYTLSAGGGSYAITGAASGLLLGLVV